MAGAPWCFPTIDRCRSYACRFYVNGWSLFAGFRVWADYPQVRARRLALKRSLEHGMDLVLHPCGTAPAALGAPTAGAESGSAHPASTPPLAHRATATSRSCERPTGRSSRGRSRSRCRPGYDDHPVDMRLEEPRDLPAAARHLQRHLVRRLQALRQRPDPLRGARDRPSEPSRPDRSRSHEKSRCTSRPIARPVHLGKGTFHLPSRLTVRRENQRDNDTDRYELAAQSKQVAGAAERKARARSPSIKTAYPTALSQRRPLSWMTRNLRRHRTEPPTSSFMLRNSALATCPVAGL